MREGANELKNEAGKLIGDLLYNQCLTQKKDFLISILVNEYSKSGNYHVRKAFIELQA
jgi:hypothetical protein